MGGGGVLLRVMGELENARKPPKERKAEEDRGEGAKLRLAPAVDSDRLPAATLIVLEEERIARLADAVAAGARIHDEARRGELESVTILDAHCFVSSEQHASMQKGQSKRDSTVNKQAPF